ncbi:MAG: carboxypeptidase-like regulatory domain-containing protein [Candidatus Thermoplasmatota archaeon]
MHAALNVTALLVAATLAIAGCSGSNGDPVVDNANFEDLGLQADESTGILRGVVIDEAIRPLAGVRVTVLRAAEGNVTMETKDDGLFGFDKLAPGTYFVVAQKPGFITVQGSGEVVAGEAEPDAVKLMLKPDPLNQPYVQPYHLDGYMTCSVRPMFIGLQCGFGQSNDVVNSNEALSGIPEWIQSEMTWDSTQAIGDELSLAIRCNPNDDPAGKCPDGVLTIVRAEGVSPLTATLNRTIIDAWALGGDGGNPLIINLFAFGRSDLDVWDEETIDGAQKPVTGNDCMQWGLVGQIALGFDPTTCMRATGPGLVLNQKIDVYTHVFYGFTPNEGWSFIDDGQHPAPA